MANTIKIKAGSGTPTTSNIVDRELAFDRSANKLYINDSGTIVDLTGSGASGDITSVVAGTGLSGGATSGEATLNIDSTVATLTGSQTLSNKTLASPTVTGNLVADSIDVAGDITLDADGADVILKDGGTEYGRLTQLLGGLTLKSGSSSANAVIFSTDGDAIFAEDVSISAGKTFTFDSVGLTAVQTSSESFADNNTSLMTSAAINDRIESFGYVTSDTTLSTEQVQDIVGAMFSSNTETRISATYQDGDGTIDLVVDDMTANTQLSTEQVQDIVGGMFSSNTETRVAATYDDTNGKINVVVDDMTANDNTVTTNIAGTGVSVSSGTGNSTISIGQSVGTSDTVAFGRVNLGSTNNSDYLSGNSLLTADGYIMVQGIVNESETGTAPAAITFGDGATLGNDQISLVTNGQRRLFVASNGNVTIAQNLTVNGTIGGSAIKDQDDMSSNSATHLATQQSIKAYVDAEVAGIVDSAPETLNTLNELAEALGDDDNFNNNVSSALGNRLRVDTASQGLNGTQQANAITNLGITATKAELNYVDGVTSAIQTQLDGKQASISAGTNISLSGTTLNVDDAFIKNNADDTMSGILTLSTSNDLPLRVLSTDAGCGIALGDNSTTSNYSTITVTGNSKMEFNVNNTERLELGAGSNGNLFRTDHGYIQFGPLNSGGTHIYTDTSQFFFNKRLTIGVTSGESIIGGYGDQADLILARNHSDTDHDAIHIGDNDIEFHCNDVESVSINSSGITTSGNIDIAADDSKLRLGTGNDGQIYVSSDNLIIRNVTADKDVILQSDNGSGGETAYITLDGSDTQTLFHQNTRLQADQKSLSVGADNDLRMIHDTHSYLQNTSTSMMIIQNTGQDQDIAFMANDNGSNNHVMRIKGATGGVGIGTTSPDTKLDITASGVNGVVINQDGSNADISSRLFFKEQNSTIALYNIGDTFSFRTGATINSTSGSERFQINTNGARVVDGALGVDLSPSTTDGRIDAANDVVAFSTSDKRLKENIKPLDNALDKVLKISGVSFDWKPLSEEEKKTIHGNEGHDVGVIAQEVEEVLPEVVQTRDTGYKAVKYDKIVPLLIEAIKELKEEVEELKK